MPAVPSSRERDADIAKPGQIEADIRVLEKNLQTLKKPVVSAPIEMHFPGQQ